MVPAKAVGGSFFPATADATYEKWDRLVDGQTTSPSTTTSGVGWGVRTTATSTSPYITLNLDAAYADIMVRTS